MPAVHQFHATLDTHGTHHIPTNPYVRFPWNTIYGHPEEQNAKSFGKAPLKLKETECERLVNYKKEEEKLKKKCPIYYRVDSG